MSGVGEHRELDLWGSGIKTWQDSLEKRLPKYPWFERLLPQVEESIQRLENRDAQFFYSNLPSTQRWRLYDEFKNSCAFLDIETTGLLGDGVITVAGLFDGKELKTFIKGKNLKELAPEIKKYSLLVTYGGSTFDLPFIRRQFHLDTPCDAHIDLQYMLRRLGYKGGLKQVERKFGISRKGPIRRVNGEHAPLLWKEYKRGRYKALEALIRYNAEDIINLRLLMEKAFKLSLEKIPLPVQFIEVPKTILKLPDYDSVFLKRFLRRHPF